MFIQQFHRSILLPDRQPPGDTLRAPAQVLVCPGQMSAEQHDHFVDNQAWKMNRTIREWHHHSSPMEHHSILGSRSALSVANSPLFALVTESIENESRYVDVNRIET